MCVFTYASVHLRIYYLNAHISVKLQTTSYRKILKQRYSCGHANSNWIVKRSLAITIGEE